MNSSIVPQGKQDQLVERLCDRARAESRHSEIVKAPAKVNLRLKVMGRRADGYHLLSMLNASTSLCDEIQFRVGSVNGCHIRIKPDVMVASPNEENLITKAFHAFWRAFEVAHPPVGLDVDLVKRIPIGAGLGGGSSDAGATLRFLRDIFGATIKECLALSDQQFDQRVMAEALRCGADVPYAYRGGWCWVHGIGEHVQSAAAGAVWAGKVVIAVPSKPVATGAFYDFYRQRHPSLPTLGNDEPMARFVEGPSLANLVGLISNDFEQDVASFLPEVGEGLAIARRIFPCATSLTGSGSAFFSLIPPDEEPRIEDLVSALQKVGIAAHVADFC